MRQGRNPPPCLVHFRKIKIDESDARIGARIDHDLTPGVHCKAVTMCAAALAMLFGVKARLRGGQHKAAGLDRAGA